MNEEQKIKKKIMDDLKKRPQFKIFCLLCKKECGNFSEKREMVHYDCWVQWRKRQKPQ